MKTKERQGEEHGDNEEEEERGAQEDHSIKKDYSFLVL